MRHYRKTVKLYEKLKSKDEQLQGCSFCNDYKNGTFKLVSEGKTMLTVHIRLAYDLFEGQRVTDHLMIIPKRHVEAIAEFTDTEKLEQMTIMGEYEKLGYEIYARGVGAVSRSIAHQHTHLIKPENITKLPRFLLFINKPFFVIDWQYRK